MVEPQLAWEASPLPHLDALPWRVTPRAQHMAKRQRFPMHEHPWHQFVHIISGCLVTTVRNAWYLLSPEQAMWMPAGTLHTSGAMQAAEFRSLYVSDTLDLGMPRECMMMRVTPLLRALIVELGEIDRAREKQSYVDHLESLILAQLPRQPEQSLRLPWPVSPGLRRICDELFTNPSDARDLTDWGRSLGACNRTLTRHFEKELGIGFREWRTRLRLFKAIDRLHSRESITSIALQLGYSTPSAFCFMFRQQMGCTPSEWQHR